MTLCPPPTSRKNASELHSQFIGPTITPHQWPIEGHPDASPRIGPAQRSPVMEGGAPQPPAVPAFVGAQSGECPPGRFSTRQARKSGIICCRSQTQPPRTPSPQTILQEARSCATQLERSPSNSSTFLTLQVDLERTRQANEDRKWISPCARRNRFMPSALRSGSSWKRTTQLLGLGDAFVLPLRTTSANQILTRQSSSEGPPTVSSGSSAPKRPPTTSMTSSSKELGMRIGSPPSPPPSPTRISR